MLHRTRDLLIRQRTQLINALARAPGRVRPCRGDKACDGLEGLVAIVREETTASVPDAMQAGLAGASSTSSPHLQQQIGELERCIQAQHRASDASRRLETIPGIGVIGATAIAADGRPIPAPSSRDASSPLGSASCRDRIRPAAKRGSAASPSKAIATCGAYWSSARRAVIQHAQSHPDKHPWLMTAAGKTAGQSGRGRGRQQDGAHRMGGAGQGRNLSSAGARGSRSEGAWR